MDRHRQVFSKLQSFWVIMLLRGGGEPNLLRSRRSTALGLNVPAKPCGIYTRKEAAFLTR